MDLHSIISEAEAPAVGKRDRLGIHFFLYFGCCHILTYFAFTHKSLETNFVFSMFS